MKNKYVHYAALGLFATVMSFSAFVDLTRAKPVVEGFEVMGYPLYLATLLGTWKALGVLAITVGRFPRLREWAFAGFFFDLTGAVVSHMAAGEAVTKLVFPILILGVGAVAYWWQPRPAELR